MRLADELRYVLNKHSAENGSNTPDFVLATYLDACLEAFDRATRQREEFYGWRLEPAQGGPVRIRGEARSP